MKGKCRILLWIPHVALLLCFVFLSFAHFHKKETDCGLGEGLCLFFGLNM